MEEWKAEFSLRKSLSFWCSCLELENSNHCSRGATPLVESLVDCFKEIQIGAPLPFLLSLPHQEGGGGVNDVLGKKKNRFGREMARASFIKA